MKPILKTLQKLENRDIDAHIIMDAWKTRISTQAAGLEFVYSWLFSLIFTVYCTNVSNFVALPPLLLFPRFSPAVSARPWYLLDALPRIWGGCQHPGDKSLTSCCRYHCAMRQSGAAAGEEALSSPELKWSRRRRMRLEKQLAWDLQAAPLSPPNPPPPSLAFISTHSDTVTNILEGRPWHSCKQGGEKKRRGQHNPRFSVIQGRLLQCPTTQRVILRQLGEY